jgi:aspartyl-tRNA(Asn)/glutamyl-tRNA(Gln) amidotransferase subunit A
VRSPAALCGIAGLKPKYDSIDRRVVIPLAPSYDHAGPTCWTVEDCGISFHALVHAMVMIRNPFLQPA